MDCFSFAHDHAYGFQAVYRRVEYHRFDVAERAVQALTTFAMPSSGDLK